MKLINLFILTFSLFKGYCQADTSHQNRNLGWLIYMPDNNIVFVVSNSGSIQNEKHFFKDTLYQNGVNVTANTQAASFRQKAKKYKISEWKDKRANTWIRILPVYVTIEKTTSTPTALEYSAYYRNGHETQLSYRFLNSYTIIDITPTK